MASHAAGRRRVRPVFRVTARVTGTVIAALVAALLGTGPGTANASPGAGPSAFPPTAAAADMPAAPPGNADDAKRAWIKASLESEAVGQRMLGVQATEQAAQRISERAAGALAQAEHAAQVKRRAVDAADKTLAGYQAQVDAFANASLRGARFSQLAVLLTAPSPQVYLDEVSSLQQVAANTQETLDAASAAKQRAERAGQAAFDAEDRARAAKRDADAATAAATGAEAELAKAKSRLDAEIHTYRLAYARLSAADRSAAVAQVESANLAANASAASLRRQGDQAAQRAAAGMAETAAVVDTGPAFAARMAAAAPNVKAGIAVEAALSRQGLPYVWAAVGPNAFDCSGLMMWAWAQAGVHIPRASYEQAASLPQVPLDQLRPGDLVTYYSPVSHVGMYVGDGLVIHASMPGVPIKVVNLFAAGPDPTGHRVNP